MKTLIATLAVLALLPSTAAAHSRVCPPIAHNERTVADNIACWRASELELGAREQLYKVRWHGQDFELYNFRCKALETFVSVSSTIVSTWHFNCERGRRYDNFTWRFS